MSKALTEAIGELFNAENLFDALSAVRTAASDATAAFDSLAAMPRPFRA